MADDAWIDTVRIARDLGGVSILLPDGIEHFGDCPFNLHRAITDSLRILSYEEFPTDERPPRAIWHRGEKLDEWWRGVEAARADKYGTTAPDEGDYEENGVELIGRG
jgi:hypothetical protein